VFQATTAYRKIASLKKDIRILQGGTSASKTISALLYLIDYAQSTEGKLISVVSESLPHMKKGALKDFLTIMKAHGYYKEHLYNRTDRQYTFETGSIMEFFGIDDETKARGPRRDVLFVNEANNIGFNVYDQMEVRTAEFTILDYNPTTEFWVHTEVKPNHDHDFIILTYKDNEALPEKMVRKIEARKYNENWWKVYGLGQIGVLEGLIFTNWTVVPKVPEEARLERYIVDFGYTNDDAAIGALYKWNGGFLIDEIGFGSGIKNRQIANMIRRREGLPEVETVGQYEGMTNIMTVADSAEPKSIDELSDFGVRAKGSTKGKGSVNASIEQTQDQTLYITQNSLNYIKAFRNYQWAIDKKTGKPTNVPEHEFSHGPDSVRYGVVDILGFKQIDYSMPVM
jgi:phage terminase large subunit